MKCAICGNEIKTNFLGKIKGNYIKYKGKTYVICNECMKKYKTKEKIIEILNSKVLKIKK